MDATIWLVVLWLAFAATHMGLSSLRWRPRLVGVLGERAFAGIYSLIALGIFVPLVRVYFAHKHEGPFLWYLGGVPGLRYAVYVGMALAFVLLVGGLARPSPSSFRVGPSEARGVQRVTRHPVFMAAGLYGFLHLLVASVGATELAFFGGFPVFAVLGSMHQDARKLAAPGSEAYRRFCAETSLLPDPRGIAGALRDVPVPAAIGIVAAAALRFFHPTLFGP